MVVQINIPLRSHYSCLCTSRIAFLLVHLQVVDTFLISQNIWAVIVAIYFSVLILPVDCYIRLYGHLYILFVFPLMLILSSRHVWVRLKFCLVDEWSIFMTLIKHSYGPNSPQTCIRYKFWNFDIIYLFRYIYILLFFLHRSSIYLLIIFIKSWRSEDLFFVSGILTTPVIITVIYWYIMSAINTIWMFLNTRWHFIEGYRPSALDTKHT